VSFFERDARAFAEALFAGPSGPPPDERLRWLVDDLSDFLAQSGPRSWAVIAGGLEVATWLAPPLVGKLPPLARLSVEDRCRALERLEHTPAGLPLLAVKAILCILYYEHPDVLAEIGVTKPGEAGASCLVELRRPAGAVAARGGAS
jgi:hypothetical protein